MNRKYLVAACGAHIVQDGMVALQYVLLPVLAQIFNLGYAQVGFLRAVGHFAMSGIEIPAGILGSRFGERRLLGFGLVCAGAGYIGIAFSPGYAAIALCLVVAGTGAGFQHSLASSLITRSYGPRERRLALGTYNSSGDAGKLAFTGLFSAGIGIGLAWNWVLVGLALVSVLFGIWVWYSLDRSNNPDSRNRDSDARRGSDRGWGIEEPGKFFQLGVVVFLDSLVQAVFLTYLAFIMLDKGLSTGIASASVVIALVGGMAGKYVTGRLATRFGDRRTFVALQILSILGIALLIVVPGTVLLALLPVIGLAIQGTSTVTYGTVADFVHSDKQSRGYALIYTVSGIASVFGPLLFGLLADYAGLETSIWALAIVAGAALPFCGVLLSRLPLQDQQ